MQARRLVQENFGLSSQAFMVVVHSDMQSTGDPAFPSGARLGHDSTSRKRHGRLGRPEARRNRLSRRAWLLVTAGSSGTPTEAVAAADGLKHDLARLGSDGVSVSLTGASGMWSDFNEANKRRCLQSELISWPVTLAILVVAFGSLVAAGLPLLLR